MTKKSLIVAEKLDAVKLYTEGGMKVILAEIEAKVKAFTPDVSTEKSREEITSFAYKIARSKTLLDDLGKEIVSEWKAKSKKVDIVRKEARDFCDALKAQVRKPLDEWEAEEKERREEEERKERKKNEARMTAFLEYGKVVPLFDVAAMSEEEFNASILLAKGEHEAEQERLAKEEADRKAEAERLAKEKEELERQKAEQEAIQRKIDEENRKIKEAQAEAQRKLDEEKAALEAEKRKEQERKDREEFKRQAKIKAEREAKEKAERDEQERLERERAEKEEKARQEALRPDKEKLLDFVDMVMGLGQLNIKLASPEAQTVYDDAIREIIVIANSLKIEVEDM